MPYDEKYYNTSEGWLRSIHPKQYLRKDTHLIEVLKKLQEYPFLLVDYQFGGKIDLYNEDILLPKSIIEKRSITHDRVVSYEDTLDINASQDLELLREELDIPSILSTLFGKTAKNDNISHISWQKARLGDDNELLNVMNDIASKTERSDRFGIITISDINRRPMKEMIYRALSELEITISKNIESEYDDSRRLFKPARPNTIGRWEKDQLEGLGLHIAEYMTLIELQKCLKMSDDSLVDDCGFDSKNDVDDLSSINNLRNKVMHSNRTLVHNRRDIKELLDNLYRIEEIINDASAVKHW